MKQTLIYLTLILTCTICTAQNLVPNGDFEQYSTCPTGLDNLLSSLFWFKPTSGTSDYYNQCATYQSNASVPYNYMGYQQAHSGVAYAGLVLWNSGNGREYIATPLTNPLVTNVCYHFEMYVNLGNSCRFATDALGVYFSPVNIWVNGNSYLPLVPQINNSTGMLSDTLGWTLIADNYLAAGGENYIVIGDFKNDSNTAVAIVDSTQTLNLFSYIFIDDVSLTSCTTGINELTATDEIKIYPNPLMDKLNINVNNTELSEIILYDITSRKLLQQKFINSISLNTEQLAKGIYLYEVRNKNGVCKKGKVVKY